MDGRKIVGECGRHTTAAQFAPTTEIYNIVQQTRRRGSFLDLSGKSGGGGGGGGANATDSLGALNDFRRKSFVGFNGGAGAQVVAPVAASPPFGRRGGAGVTPGMGSSEPSTRVTTSGAGGLGSPSPNRSSDRRASPEGSMQSLSGMSEMSFYADMDSEQKVVEAPDGRKIASAFMGSSKRQVRPSLRFVEVTAKEDDDGNDDNDNDDNESIDSSEAEQRQDDANNGAQEQQESLKSEASLKSDEDRLHGTPPRVPSSSLGLASYDSLRPSDSASNQEVDSNITNSQDEVAIVVTVDEPEADKEKVNPDTGASKDTNDSEEQSQESEESRASEEPPSSKESKESGELPSSEEPSNSKDSPAEEPQSSEQPEQRHRQSVPDEGPGKHETPAQQTEALQVEAVEVVLSTSVEQGPSDEQPSSSSRNSGSGMNPDAKDMV